MVLTTGWVSLVAGLNPAVDLDFKWPLSRLDLVD